jgi:hypothetical protein
MKAAVSTPEGIVGEAESLDHHAPERVIDLIDHAVRDVGKEPDEFRKAAARRAIQATDW